MLYISSMERIAPILSEHAPPQEILEALRKKIAECETLRTKCKARDQKIETLDRECETLRTKCKARDQKIETLDRECETLRTKCEARDREMETLEAKCETQEKKIQDLRKEIRALKQELAFVRSQKYRPKSERHDRSQYEMFPDQVSAAAWHEVERKERRKKTGKKRVYMGKEFWKNAGLPVETVRMDPPDNLPPDAKLVGYVEREKLARKPGQLYVKCELYPVFAREDGTKLCEAPLPTDRGLRKCRADESLLTHLVLSKYLYHLPIERIVKQLHLESGVQISKSTATDWVHLVASRLDRLNHPLRMEVLADGYIQADETRILVQDRAKSRAGGTYHRGWYFFYTCPISGLILVDYQPTRSRAGPTEMLEGFRGELQTDGYAVYHQFGKIDGIELFACWAHARRKFKNALRAEGENSPQAEQAVVLIQQLYAVEDELREQGADAAERVRVRQEQSVPLLQVLEALLREHTGDNDTFWFRAVRYTLKLWDRLSGFTRNGRVEIDNNLVENRVRPIALGRKNYLFAGSHAAAANAATIYSLLSTCQLHEVHPQEWLMDILRRVETTPDEELHTLLPHHWKATRQEEQQVPLAKAA